MDFPVTLNDQSELDAIISERLAREKGQRKALTDERDEAVKSLAEATAKAEELEEKLNSLGLQHQGELDGLKEQLSASAEEVERLKGDLTSQRLTADRAQAAAKYGLPLELITGNSSDEITERCEALKAFGESQREQVQSQVLAMDKPVASYSAAEILGNPV